RAWKSRIKGRDLYDYVFYLTKGTSVNQKHLRERLLQSGYITSDAPCTLENIKAMLLERFDSINYAQAKRDVEPFIRDTSALNVWCAEFFRQITEQLTVI
ncbi:MAG: nucleotidyl transferase AbiEii/AbiGii toxin family protein, partial [Lachnospiraceae bacterium]|nr:nucleotidyl transferase AbiEii/AbiGii toxin family protein [Lachnospiraceae bacterium]